jgi:CHAD domain-containing protein
MDRIARYHSRALRALDASLTSGTDHVALHHLRVTLRRLQAYFELAGELQQSQVIAQCVSKLSPLRTLHVFERYLAKTGAPKEDIRVLQERIDTLSEQFIQEQVYHLIKQNLVQLAFPPAMPPHWLLERLRLTRAAHADALHTLVGDATNRPRKKSLHALRLRIKSVRYQEEWASDHTASGQTLIRLLKRAQDVLGQYQERAQFRKMAKKLDLKSVKRIRKDWRRARKRARALPPQLVVVIETLLKKTATRPRAKHRTPRDFSRQQSAG